ncbi:hypothetical protein HT031_003339 [Scenedesmus sp. PABB004]|nr:hypothetical protein HT031_003339 [Scenedesmus sp. PABB004]
MACRNALFGLALLAMLAVGARAAAAAADQAAIPSGTGPTTCCTCRCVIPAKQPVRAPGMLGAIGPSYGTVKKCVNGFATSCDAACLVNKGTYTLLHECK